MELFEAIQNRYSYRGNYLADKVPFDDLKKIVEAGMAAPSGCNRQTTSFVIVDDEEILSAIRGILMSHSVKTAPAAIVAALPIQPDDELTFEKEDCAAAVQNMLLAVTALGYASCWIDGELLYEGKAQKISELLKLPKGMIARVLLPVGKAASEGKRKTKLAFEQRTCRNQCK